jgi:hypothetical protein
MIRRLPPFVSNSLDDPTSVGIVRLESTRRAGSGEPRRQIGYRVPPQHIEG